MAFEFPSFEDDGCTFWFDEWFGTNVRHCCDVHDEAFAYGTTTWQWVTANLDLVKCGLNAGVPLWAVLAGAGLFLFSAPIFFLGRKKTNDHPA